MGSSTVSSLPHTYHFLKNDIPTVSPNTTTTGSYRSVLAARGRQREGRGGHTGGHGGNVLTWRGQGGYTGVVALVIPKADKEVLE